MPTPEGALEQIKAVPGVLRAEARLWGIARVGERSLSVSAPLGGPPPPGLKAPQVGEALIGPALDLPLGAHFALEGARKLSLEVIGQLPERSGLVAHDLILLAPQDLQSLLGLAPGLVSDLAVWVLHESEIEAIRPDLKRALPFPVRISSIKESLGAAEAQIKRAAGLRSLLLLPALLALTLLSLAMARIQLGARREIGLLKALGWSGGEIIRLQLSRGLIIALPALALGWTAAYLLIFGSGLRWAGPLLFGWSGPPPQLLLDPSGALLTLLELGALVIAPWMAAIALPALRSVQADPEEWLRGENL